MMKIFRGFAHAQEEHDDGQQHDLRHGVNEIDERAGNAVYHRRLTHGHARRGRQYHGNDDTQHHAVGAVKHVLPQTAGPLPHKGLRHHPRHGQDGIPQRQRSQRPHRHQCHNGGKHERRCDA